MIAGDSKYKSFAHKMQKENFAALIVDISYYVIILPFALSSIIDKN